MGDWLVIIGTAIHLIGSAVMFSDLMELRGVRTDAAAMERQLATGVIGNRWIRLGVQLIVVAGLLLVVIGLVVGID
ncbi:MAG: hypothetical protein KQH83_10415 [Actinobacteria bacterium]|nr:hypothetical protein [Actinomycetota bacterium]